MKKLVLLFMLLAALRSFGAVATNVQNLSQFGTTNRAMAGDGIGLSTRYGTGSERLMGIQVTNLIRSLNALGIGTNTVLLSGGTNIIIVTTRTPSNVTYTISTSNNVSLVDVTNIVNSFVAAPLITNGNTIFVDDVIGNDTTGALNMPALPCLTISNALSKITNGTVIVGDGEYDVNLCLDIPNNVNLIARGKVLIQSRVALTNGGTLKPGDNTIIRGINILNTNQEGSASFGIFLNDRTAFTNVVVEDCNWSTPSDIIFLFHTNACTARFYNCTLSTWWDGILPDGSTNHNFEFYGCRFKQGGVWPGEELIQVRPGSGTVKLYGSTIELGPNTNGVVGLAAVGLGTDHLEMHGGNIRLVQTNASSAICVLSSAQRLIVNGVTLESDDRYFVTGGGTMNAQVIYKGAGTNLFAGGTNTVVAQGNTNLHVLGGRVGIGTNNPSYPLHIFADDITRPALEISYTSGAGTPGPQAFQLRAGTGVTNVFFTTGGNGFLASSLAVGSNSTSAGLYVDGPVYFPTITGLGEGLAWVNGLVVRTNATATASLTGTTNYINLSVQAAKFPTTDYAAVSGFYQNWELIYYKTNEGGTITPLSASWQFVVPPDYATNTMQVYLQSTITATNGPNTSNVVWRASFFRATSGDQRDIHTNSFGSTASGTNDWAASPTNNFRMQSLQIDTSAVALLQANDLAILKLERVNTNDTVVVPSALVNLQLRYVRQ